jgi:hypothetical protein
MPFAIRARRRVTGIHLTFIDFWLGQPRRPVGGGLFRWPDSEMHRSIHLSEWDEDEQQIATYHRRAADLAALRTQVPGMPADEQASATAELAQRLKDEQSPVMRAELVRALGEFRVPTAQAAVVAAMSDESSHVRIAASKALGRHPSQEGFLALSSAVADAAIKMCGSLSRAARFKGLQPPPAARIDDNDRRSSRRCNHCNR